MRCPYCVSEIPDEALVCSVCRRDLYVVKPLLEKIAGLESQLAARMSPSPVTAAAEASPVVIAAEPASAAAPFAPWRAMACWLLPIVLLLLGHWLLIFVYDAKVLYLRVLALLLPLPFGFLFARRVGWPFLWNLLPAAVMAVAAVWAMSGLTALIDKVPVLPQSMVEVREFIEFAASISLSFTTGLWLQSWWQRRTEAQRLANQDGAVLGGRKVTESLTRLNDFGSAIVAVGTTVVSIYTGLKGVLG